MFVMRDAQTFEWPVDVKIPSQKRPGTFDVERFYGTFAVLAPEEADEIARRIAEVRGDEATEELATFASRFLVGWRDIKSEDDQPVPYSVTALGVCFRMPWFRAGVFAAYADATNGRGSKARRGN